MHDDQIAVTWVPATPSFSLRKEVLLPDMNLSTVVALVSLAACLACSDAEPTNMIFMLMDDVSFSHSPRRDNYFNKFCGCMHRWAGETSACTAIQQKKHPTWTRWRLRECCYRITTLPIRSALLVCGFIIKINNQWLCAAKIPQLLFFWLFAARSALLTGRLPIRNGFYTTNDHARNGN